MSESGAGVAGLGIVDAHLHLWDLATGEYTWNTAALGPVHASFGPVDAAEMLASAQVDRAVLVQAADTIGDSDRMFAAAVGHPWIAGVVAWIRWMTQRGLGGCSTAGSIPDPSTGHPRAPRAELACRFGKHRS